MAILEVEGVTRRFGAVQALAGATFQVEEGEVFGLLGPNGAGKTTLMGVISRLIPPDSGTVRFDGDPSRLIGVVPQELALYDNLTALENLRFFGELYGLSGAGLASRAAALLAAVGLEARASSLVESFSGGMKRRLNLAVSLIHAPRLLLLDEPTVGVDPQSRNLIFEEVRRLNRQGMTIVYTSHYMEEVEALCTRVGIIDQGRVIACDTLPNLLRSLRGLIRAEVKGGDLGLLERRLNDPPGMEARRTGSALEVECADVKSALIRLISLMNEAGVELLRLETEEPNLERVFLHLTGRALRD
jgi:ABC-2 type transport system ATP-binding protein